MRANDTCNTRDTTSPCRGLRADPENEARRLVNTYSNLILRLSFTYLKSTHDAQDICQDVLIKLIERQEPFQNTEHEKAWVIRATANACKDTLRKSYRRTSAPLEEAAEHKSPEEPEGSAGAVAATGNLTTVQGLLDDVFNGAPASTEVTDAIGRPIGASASCNGVTITADAVVGDRWNYVVVFSIARDDGKSFDVEPLETGTLPLMFDGPSGIHIDWMEAGGGGIHFYDADPTDNAIQMVQSMSADTFDGKSIIGNTARAHLENLYAIDDAGERHLIAEGSWDLKFEMNYDDTTIDLPAGFSVDYNDLSADIESVAISPIGITVDYTAHDVMNWQKQDDGKMSDRNSTEMDRILNMPILVTLANGTVIDATESGSASKVNDNGTTSVHKTYVFDIFANPEDIESVTIAGTEVWQQ